MAAKKKAVNKNTYTISSIKLVTKKFLEVSRCSSAKQRKMYKKSMLHVQSFFFSLIRPTDFLVVFVAVAV